MSKQNDRLRKAAQKALSEMTDEEEAAINAGIAADPDNPELIDEDFARMRPAEEVVPDIVAAYKQGRLGRPRKESPKVSTTIRLDAEVIEHFRKQGAGWQSRINEALRKVVGL